jgi:phosphatidylserine/phosphatidylglycerophosphate/cardiolipin synthase-like enzyme
VRAAWWALCAVACSRADAEPPTWAPSAGGAGVRRVADLVLAPTDAWGRSLAGASLELDRAAPSGATRDEATGALRLGLGSAPFTWSVRVSAPDHDDLYASLRWDGAEVASDDPRVVVATRTDGERPAFAAVLMLDHGWFAASGPPHARNEATLLRDGEDYWASVAVDVARARRRVTWSTWWWESTFELVRPSNHATLGPAARASNGALALLEAQPGVTSRVLVNLFGDLELAELVNTDAALRARAEDPADAVEAMLQPNRTPVPLWAPYVEPEAPIDRPGRVGAQAAWSGWTVLTPSPPALMDGFAAPAASWHQKALVVDGETAFVSGMNTKGTDWDDHAHALYDARRMESDASNAARASVEAGAALPDFGPRKDYGLRLAGPAAYDVEAILSQRWNRAIDDGELYAFASTPLELDAAPDEVTDGVAAQVEATLPAPWSQRAILETHERAMRRATSLVYIEDQYFRAPLLLDAIIARMGEEPGLRLVVVTKPMSNLDPGAQHTFAGHAQLRAMFPDRYLALQLRSVDVAIEEGFFFDTVRFEQADVDVHSKLRIVDDRYLSVGSCNFNNRGYLYEGELNATVFDEAWVSTARREVFIDLLGDAWEDGLAYDDRALFDALARTAASNDAILAWWSENARRLDAEEAAAERAARWPAGLVYPLDFSDGYLWDVGTDAF